MTELKQKVREDVPVSELDEAIVTAVWDAREHVRSGAPGDLSRSSIFDACLKIVTLADSLDWCSLDRRWCKAN